MGKPLRKAAFLCTRRLDLVSASDYLLGRTEVPVAKSVTTVRRLSSLGLSFALVVSILPAILSPLILPAEKALAAPSTAECAQTVGTPSALTVSVVGNDCLLTFTATTTWTIPTYLSSGRVLLVGGGAGGFIDGGGGGGGGGGLENSSATFLPGKSATITVGTGGSTNSNGNSSQIDITGDGTADWSASGGNAGGGWTTRVGGVGGATAAQSGATVYNGGNGGNGPTSDSSGLSSTTHGANGFTSSITGTSTIYGGGGGGGMSSHSNNSPSTVVVDGSNGGNGGGGRGAAQRAINSTVTWSYNTGFSNGSLTLTAFCLGNASFPGTTTGFAGLNGYGGGGGGGSAYGDGCNGGTTTDGERNEGGRGGDGVVIIRFTLPSETCSPSSSTNGGFTTLTFTSTTPCLWTVPSGVTVVETLVVGAGGGGGADGGSGGGGGELRYAASQSLTPGSVLVVTIGIGGNGGNRINATAATAGGRSGISNLSSSSGNLFVAFGGSGGLGWTVQTTISGGTGGSGGTGTAGQNGGLGPTICSAVSEGSGGFAYGSSPTGTAPSNGITGSTLNYGGGGGGGSAYALLNSGTAKYGLAGGGTNSGGRGANYKFGRDGSAIQGASNGSDGFANSGGGGGGGSACDAFAAEGATFSTTITQDGSTFTAGQAVDGRAQRTNGGNGANGVAIIKYINAPSISLSTPTITATIGTPVTSYSIINSGGAATSYSISPALSVAGLSFSSSTGLISGTPSAVAASSTYTITASNSSGSSSATFSLCLLR